jgi:predicted hydrolase (HD superfamily)
LFISENRGDISVSILKSEGLSTEILNAISAQAKTCKSLWTTAVQSHCHFFAASIFAHRAFTAAEIFALATALN